MTWETVIGLEVHVQINTQSKIFSGASTAFGAAPNAHASVVECALPGVLPVMNREVINKAIKLGLALGATINRKNVFDRKNYFYPDLPKGYQISQLDLPIIEHGQLEIVVGEALKTINVTRAHMEEDAGKSVHDAFPEFTGIDLNRAGTPLLEVVSEPEMRSAAEAVAYARALHTLVTWLDICDGNMAEGSFRIDANVSVRPLGQAEFGTRCEIKNLNSFRFLEQAINYEVVRQIELIEDGGKVVQQTRLFDPDSGETRAMRSKEDAHDYRYFPDPDLLPLVIDADWIARVEGELPELPAALSARFQGEYGLSAYDATTLTASRETAQYYLDVVAAAGAANAKTCANWVMGELAARLNKAELDITASPVSAAQLAGIILKIADGTINSAGAKTLFAQMWESMRQRGSFSYMAASIQPLSSSGGNVTPAGISIDEMIERLGLKQVTDSGAIEAIIDEVLAANQKSVEEFRAGKEKAFNALVGQCMKASKGKANPAQVNEILKKKLG